MKSILAITKALADRNRVRILMALRGGPLCVCQIIELLGLAPSTVSRHMNILRQAGLIEAEKDGRWVHYRLADGDGHETAKGAIRWIQEQLNDDAEVLRDADGLRAISELNPQELCRVKTGEKLDILFLCTGNSCRSQMAEGWARHLKGDILRPESAGLEPRELDPRAVKVMAEVGVDISGHHAKHLDAVKGRNYDYVVTLCDHVSHRCFFFPGKEKVAHFDFDDPYTLAVNAADEEETLRHYRRVRDEIRNFVHELPGIISRHDDSAQPPMHQ